MKTHQFISMKSQGDGILTLNEIREGGGLKTTNAVPLWGGKLLVNNGRKC